MEKIVVSDTNIFIDLISVNLLDGFFSLPWEIHTTDMIMKELKDSNQKAVVDAFRQLGSLKVEPTLKSKACFKCLYFTKIIPDLCCCLEYFSYLYTINQTE